MMGEKGSLKNRIKEWKLKRQYKKKIKEKKILEEKNAKKEKDSQKNNSEYIIIQNMTEKSKNGLKKIFGFMFAFIENICTNACKKESKTKKIILKPEEKYIYKQVELENISLYEKDDFVGGDNDKENTKEKIIVGNESKTEGKTTIEESIVDDEFKQEEKTMIEEKDEVNIAIEEQALQFSDNKLEDNKNIINLQNSDTDNDLLHPKEEQENTQLLKAVQFITNEISEIDNKLNIIEESDKDIKETRKETIAVKGEIQALKKYYEESISPKKASLKDLSNDIDPYNIRVSPKKMNQLLQKCDIELSKIKKEIKNKVLEDLEINKELECIKAVIEENLEEQKKDIDKLKDEFNKAGIKEKRPTLVKGIHNFLSKTMNIGLSLLPFTICKNKIIGILGSAVILNNRLRSMRKIIRKDNNNINFITYKNIANEINNRKSCVDKTKEMLEDSLHQLQNLKQEFIMEFYYDMDRYSETENIMTEIASIEYQITSKTLELEEMRQTLGDVEIQNKQKIKTINNKM